MHGCEGCFRAGGDHSGARRHAREARLLRNSVVAAHAAAAEAIERANNEVRGVDMWTLDLHGLHVAEAVASVDRRYRLLSQKGRVLNPNGCCTLLWASLARCTFARNSLMC